VVGQVAVSLVLLVGAGLALTSFRSLLARSTGFAPGHVLTLTAALPEQRYPDAARRLAFFEGVLAKLEALPGVERAAAVNVLPSSTYDRETRILLEGAPEPLPGAAVRAAYRATTPGYFDTLGIPLVRGRDFDARDREGAPAVVIVNERLARRELGDASPIGRRLRLGGPAAQWREIVGIVGDVRHWSLSTDPDAEAYVPLAQASESMMMLAVRTSGDPIALATAARQAVLEVDKEQPVYHVAALGERIAETLLLPRVAALFVTTFAAAALLLASLGLYALLAYVVGARAPELGLRMALGASAGDVLREVLGRGLRLVAGGLVLGGALAFALARLAQRLFFGVSASDPWLYAATASAVMLAGLVAVGLPAARAARLDPARALRGE
jgi:putative ABC transport system permease protein